MAKTTKSGPGARQRYSPKFDRTICVAIVLGILQLLVGIFTAHLPSYWGDEAATISVAQRSVPDMMRLLMHVDAVHGVYYFIQNVLMSLLGNSPLSLRLLSVVSIALTVSCIVILAARLDCSKAGIYAGTVAFLLPGLAWASSEMRSTAFVSLLAVITMLALESATRKGSVGRWVAYAVALILLVWVFVFAALIAFPAATLALARARTRPFILSSALAALASLPIIAITSRQVGQISWIPNDPKDLFSSAFIGQYFFGQRPYDAFDRPVALLAIGLAFLTAGILVWYTRFSWMQQRWTVWFIGIAWTIAPTVLLICVTIFVQPIYVERYLTFTASGLCLLIGSALASVSLRKALSLLVTFCLLASPILVCQKQEDFRWDNYAALARFVNDHKAPGAVAIYSEVRANGVSTAYPKEFEGVSNVSRIIGPLDDASFWGRNRPSSEFDLRNVVGRQVFVFTLTVYSDDYPDVVDPYLAMEDDPYVKILMKAKCSVSEVSTITTFTAYIFSC